MTSGAKITNDLIATRVASTPVTASSSTFTGTETVLVSVTAYLISGRRYKIAYPARFQSSVAGDNVQVRIREDSLTGTQLQAAQVNCATTSTVGFDLYSEAEYTAVATGNKTFVVTGQRGTGTGNITMLAATTSARVLSVEYIPT